MRSAVKVVGLDEDGGRVERVDGLAVSSGQALRDGRK